MKSTSEAAKIVLQETSEGVVSPAGGSPADSQMPTPSKAAGVRLSDTPNPTQSLRATAPPAAGSSLSCLPPRVPAASHVSPRVPPTAAHVELARDVHDHRELPSAARVTKSSIPRVPKPDPPGATDSSPDLEDVPL